MGYSAANGEQTSVNLLKRHIYKLPGNYNANSSGKNDMNQEAVEVKRQPDKTEGKKEAPNEAKFAI